MKIHGPKNNYSKFKKNLNVEIFSIASPTPSNIEEFCMKCWLCGAPYLGNKTVDPHFLICFMKILGPKNNYSKFKKNLNVEIFSIISHNTEVPWVNLPE